MKSKIALLTFQRTANFGAALQAYALWQKLQDMGCDCEILDYHCEAVEKREGIDRKSPAFSKNFLHALLVQPAIHRKAKNLYEFLEHHNALSCRYEKTDLARLNSLYSHFIVGSDMVWYPSITENDLTFFLDFVNSDIPKFSFASSTGDLSGNDVALKLLAKFQTISVREESSADSLRYLLNREIYNVCDPTMLLTVKEWDRYVQPKEYKSAYVLVYFPGSKCLQDARAYAKKHRCAVKLITTQLRPISGVQSIFPTSIAEFVGLIKHAEFVFTASYHGMLFSSYYHRPFLFYTRGNSGDARLINLAKRLGLSSCHGNDRELSDITPIDYVTVDKLTESYRHESILFLEEIIRSTL